uniref:Uncharacterized protein n=1 Tax=Globodera rostochiensis TaxID=31243 RepID=A0A914HCD8_GLORO
MKLFKFFEENKETFRVRHFTANKRKHLDEDPGSDHRALLYGCLKFPVPKKFNVNFEGRVVSCVVLSLAHDTHTPPGTVNSGAYGKSLYAYLSMNMQTAIRKKDLTGNSIRKILLHAAEMVPLFETEWPKAICLTLTYLGKIQAFSKAQPLLAREVGELEDHMDNFKAFLHEQPEMRLLLAHKPKAHLLLVHFVPFARQHRFLGLMDEQGDEALHSVWRRLEQFWKTMPDAEQMRQQLENHFVSNWLLDTGKFEEMQMLRMEEQSTGELEEDRMDEERDEDGFIDLIG